MDNGVQTLSGGELQRCAIVLCLGTAADIYLVLILFMSFYFPFLSYLIASLVYFLIPLPYHLITVG